MSMKIQTLHHKSRSSTRKWMTKAALVELLKCSRPTLDAFLAAHPEVKPRANGQYHAELVREAFDLWSNAGGKTTEAGKLKMEKLRHEVRVIAVKADEAERRVIDAEDFARDFTAVEMARSNMLRQKLEVDMPPMVIGKTIEEVRVYAAQLVDEICALHREVYERARVLKNGN